MSELKNKIIAEVKKIYDPEIPVNIYELGLIYNIIVDENNNVKINMTLTSPNCPVAESLPNEVKDSIMKINEVNKVFKSRSYVFQAEVEFWALANQDDEIRNRSQELYEKIINLFELVINKGIREKEFIKVDTRITAIYILSVFQGINWFCIFNDKKINAKDYIKNLLN